MPTRKQDDLPAWFTGTPTWAKVAMGVAAGAAACQLVHAIRSGRARFSMTTPQRERRPKQRLTFAEVGGHDELKRQIERRIITPFREPSLFARFKKRIGGGILMYGPPGCGKTLLARATAGQCNATFFNVAVSDVLDMWLGESERKLAEIFTRARAAAPAVLFFDELDGLIARQHRESTHSGIVSQFLAELDGFAGKNSGVLILGATNIPWAIDPAFRRPGRFDRIERVVAVDDPHVVLGVGPYADRLTDVPAVRQRLGPHRVHFEPRRGDPTAAGLRRCLFLEDALADAERCEEGKEACPDEYVTLHHVSAPQ